MGPLERNTLVFRLQATNQTFSTQDVSECGVTSDVVDIFPGREQAEQ